MSRPRVFISRRIPQVGIDLVASMAETEVWPDPLPPPRDVLLEKVANADGILSLLTDRIDEELLAQSPRLRVVANMAVGFNNIDVVAATRRGVVVGNTPGVLTDATADMTVALLLAAARRMVEGHQFATSGAWKTWDPLGHLGLDLVGRTAGIVGMGRIGSAVARRLRFGWNMNILYHNRRTSPEAEKELHARFVSFEQLLRDSDFIIVLTDLNPATTHLFNRDAFQKMKRTAVFINAARGPLHHQGDLVEALRSGTIFAAGLDVTDPEPPAADDPLLSAPNLVLAPHIASATVDTRNKMAEMAARNIQAAILGKPLPHPVNPEVPPRPAVG
jgi:glyoxylate reductase